MSNMKIFDFNVHLPSYSTNEVNEQVADESKLVPAALKESLKQHLPSLKGVRNANFMLFNTNLFEENNFSMFSDYVNQHFEKASYTALVDFRRSDLIPYLEKVKSQKVNCIKFHAYVQKISSSDHTLIYQAARFAEENNLIICIDTSYGTTKMYSYDNLELACFICDVVSQTPVILLHSGGARTLEAMLIAEEKRNVFLESSFSLPYYLGSSVEKDLAFVYKKLGSDRIIYGSDFPYVTAEESLNQHFQFFDQYNFTTEEVEKIMFQNAMKLLTND
jgi:uncharacterized protein